MSVNINKEIQRLIQYALDKNLIQKEDIIYTTNRLLALLKINDYKIYNIEQESLDNPVPILNSILDWASKNGVLKHNTPVYRDLLDSEIMACLMQRPSEIINSFNNLYKQDPPKATNYYYELSKHSNYIRTDRIAKNIEWKVTTEYGEFDITINLSKPEKDPKAIAAAKNMASSAYPKCLLCKENEGYLGSINHPARGNHRIIPITINEEKWYLQYSPYVYYKEHCIVLKSEHVPMKISKLTFKRLLDFVELFPHYFVGSNADLPIVGGSILSHDHFQGGHYEFAMAKAPIEEIFNINKSKNIQFGIVKWPMSVIRLQSSDKNELIEIADYIFGSWKQYSDESVDILAFSNEEPHNTITPIARMRNNQFELDLVLRNNRTNVQYPDGIFHPHKDLHHIKKENIGLIEVMGLAVLPARLKKELSILNNLLLNKNSIENSSENEIIQKHMEWYEMLKEKCIGVSKDAIIKIVYNEVGLKFTNVLEHAGVFKRDLKGKKAFREFINTL